MSGVPPGAADAGNRGDRGGGTRLPVAPVDRVILFRSSRALDIKLRAVFGVLLPTTRRWYWSKSGLRQGGPHLGGPHHAPSRSHSA